MSAARTIAVVGGGISGLATAEAIERRARDDGAPVRAVVLEAEDTPGGKIKSAREDGFVLDYGPHGFLDKEPSVFGLIERLGLTGSLLRARDSAAKRFVARAGALRALPSSPPAFLTSDVLPLLARLRVLVEPLVGAKTGDEDESVFAFAERRIGRVAAEVLIDAVVTGVYGGDPAKLSIAAAFPRIRELERAHGGLIRGQIALARAGKKASGGPAGTMHSFVDGVGVFTRGLASRVEVRTRAEAKRLVRSPEGFVVETARGPVEASAVVLSVPAFVAASLLAEHAAAEAERIATIPYAPIAVVVQGYRRADLSRSPEGFGFLAPHRERRSVLGSIYASSVFPEHAPPGTVLFRTMIGGVRRGELVSRSDADLAALAREELSALAGIDPRGPALFERIVRWDRGIPQYDLGHRERVAAADVIETRLPGLFLSGNAFRGVAMIDCIMEADKVARRAVAAVLAGSSSENGRTSSETAA